MQDLTEGYTLNEGMGNRKRFNQLNYRDWNYKAYYKKTHDVHGRFVVSLDLWVDYIIQCARHYGELYEISYNRGFVDLGEEGGESYVMAREANRRI